jgi:hypothetical protein
VEDHRDCGHGPSAACHDNDGGMSLRFEMELRQDLGLAHDLIEEELDTDVKEAEIGVSYV